MPELTIPMAYHIINGLNISEDSRILDYGCAKGYLVSAFKLLGFDAYGIDISSYAIENTHELAKGCCKKATAKTYKDCDLGAFSHVISKDVFEHIPENELPEIFEMLSNLGSSLFSIIPLGIDDTSNKFVIESYHNDLSHITIKSKIWWENLISKYFPNVIFSEYKFKGCKTVWTNQFAKGNLFLYATK